MPTYLNSGSTVQFIGGLRIEPKESLETYIWADSLPAGVTKISDSPSFNPVIYSGSLTTSGSIKLPVIDSMYTVFIWVEAGAVELKFNTSNMTPVMVLTEGSKWQQGFQDRTLDSIIVNFTTGGRLWVQILKG